MRRLFLSIAALALSAPIASFNVPAATAQVASGGCGEAYYRNSRGNCVPRPVRADRPPAGASAQCRDGTYSFSQSRRGTCSHHGGVARWL
jgi:hypothetical protein